MRRFARAIYFCLACPLAVWPLHAAELPRFEMREIDPHVGNVCYAVTLADVDGDAKPDIVAVSENRVVWYHNPDWKLRVIVADQTDRDNVCIAPADIDGDGKVDFALGAGWLKQNLGTLYWLSRGESLDEPWKVYPIGRESSAHRMRWGDILFTGKPQLVVAPLMKTVGDGVRVLAFEIPAQPRNDPWRSTVVDHSLNAVHNLWLGDLEGDGSADMLTASMEGVYLFRRGADGKPLRAQVGTGSPGPIQRERSGAGEIKVGRLKRESWPYIATVEPMHGNQIAVYTLLPTESPYGRWSRHVLDDTLKRGHALGVGDIDQDGVEELIVGHSDKGTGDPAGPGIFVYDPADDTGTSWTKHVVDNGGIAVEDLVVEDLTGDGWPDIVAGGRSTHNVRLYINQGSGR